MSLAQSTAFRAAANTARKVFLDTGSAKATIEIYGNTRPVAGASPGASPLVIVTLAKPSGAVLSGVLVLAGDDPAGALILSNGIASWARFVNGNGDWAFDADVSDTSGVGEVQFPSTVLFAGGRVPLSPSTIG